MKKKEKKYYCPKCHRELKKTERGRQIEEKVKARLILWGFTDGSHDKTDGYYCEKCKILWDITDLLIY